MRYPNMQEIQRQTLTQENWYGYDHQDRIGDGSLWDEYNMGSEYYPVMAPRGGRSTYKTGNSIQGMIAKDALCWVDRDKFYMNGYAYDLGLSQRAEDCPKSLISMGAYVIVMPDRKYINTQDTTDKGSIDASWSSTGSVSFALCKEDGNGYGSIYTAATAPAEPADGTYWMDTGSTPVTLRVWSASESAWGAVATTYVKVSATNIGVGFKEGDGVTLAGASEEDHPEEYAMMGSHIIQSRGDNWIVLIGIISAAAECTETITMARTMPAVDFVVEAGNRLWGCRYGLANNGETVNEIYACKLGDFKNWNVFQGISTDSWVGACGTDGVWTGAINYQGYPTFFKADHIHKVYGSLPSSYAIQDTVCRGVEKGSEKSLAMVGGVLMYKSRTGVCVYDGSMPSIVSDALGKKTYHDAVAGAHGEKYYISMLEDGSNAKCLFTYDRKYGIWHKEDTLRAVDWCSARNEMFCIPESRDRIIQVTGDSNEDIYWYAVTGEIGLHKMSGRYSTAMPEEKRLAGIVLRMQLEKGSRVDIDIQYDGEKDFAGNENWIRAASLIGNSLRSYTVPIRARRCDWLRIRLTGQGKAKVFSLTRTIESCSDRNSADDTMVK